MAGQFVIKQIAQEVISEVNQPLYIGGIDPLGSDSKLTIASNGNVSTAMPLTVPSLTVNSKPVMSSLLAEYTVTGSAVTSIDFSGLDINTHKSYRIELNIKSGAGTVLYLYVNGDTTNANYYSQSFFANGSSVGSGRNNFPQIGAFDYANDLSTLNILIHKDSDGYPAMFSDGKRHNDSIVLIDKFVISKTATVTNITKLTFTATVANSIGVGSTIRIYRSDV